MVLNIIKDLIEMFWNLGKWPLAIICSVVALFMVLAYGNIFYLKTFKGMQKKTGEHNRIKKTRLIKKLFWDAPKQFALDYMNRDPEFFRHQGLIIYTGNQGSGKTSTMVRDIMLMQKEYPKLKVIDNFGYKYQNDELRHWKQLINYKNGIQGVVVGIDEIQNWFNSKQSKNFPPEMLQIVTTNRKNRRCICGTAQRFYMVSKDIRTQCSEVRHCLTLAGVLTIVIRKEPVVNSEGEVEKEKFRGMYCWVHSQETREAYDTYRMIDVLSQTGFKDEQDQYRLQNKNVNEVVVETKKK